MTPVELVVGADGTVGRALVVALRAAGRPCAGTSRRPGADRLLDLADPPSRWDGPPVSVVYLCAAVARLDACERDPGGTARVNVDGVAAVARTLAARGAFPVFFSTNHVFDGERSHRRPDEPVCPRNEYGRQKAAAETEVLALGGAVLRMTKVLGDTVPLFATWVTAAATTGVVRPFADMVMSPVPLGTAVASAMGIGERRRSGVYHLSAGRDITYADAATVGLTAAGFDPRVVKPVFAGPAAACPPHTTLAGDGLGVFVPEVEDTVRAAFRASTRAAA